MTRFERDLRGDFGTFWKKDAIREILKMREKFLNNEIIIEEDGAVKWKLSGNYLPEDCAQMLEYALYEYKDPKISLQATTAKREAQEKEFLAKYCEAHKNYVLTHEERYEMTCAFVKGEKVIDVITGQVFQL